MQKHFAIGRGVKILDQKNRGGFNKPPLPVLGLMIVNDSFRCVHDYTVSS